PERSCGGAYGAAAVEPMLLPRHALGGDHAGVYTRAAEPFADPGVARDGATCGAFARRLRSGGDRQRTGAGDERRGATGAVERRDASCLQSRAARDDCASDEGTRWNRVAGCACFDGTSARSVMPPQDCGTLLPKSR